MKHISELPDDEIEPGQTYEKIRGRISTWGNIDTDVFYKRDLKKFKEQERITILTKNQIVLNPIFNPEYWDDEDSLHANACRISIITLPQLSKSESIDIQE